MYMHMFFVYMYICWIFKQKPFGSFKNSKFGPYLIISPKIYVKLLETAVYIIKIHIVNLLKELKF